MDQVLAIKQVQKKIFDALENSKDSIPEDGRRFLEEISSDLDVFLAKGIDFKEVVDNLDDSIFIADKDGKILYVNPAYETNTGISFDMLDGRTVYEVISEGKLFTRGASVEVLRTRKKSYTLSTVVHTDPPQTGFAVGTPLFDDDGELHQVVVSSRPVTTLKKLKADYHRFAELVKASDNADSVKVMSKEGGKASRTMVGKSKALSDVWKMVNQVASTDATVLITGESGTGKEVVADELYKLGLRSDKPFVKINCASIPENLLEAELFGYEKGAFTGANANGKKGLFEMADKGTLLLDEIGDMPLTLQVKLLRAIQDKEITRVGGTKPIPLDIRIIAATNCNLMEKVQEGTFRQDLYYRLNVIPINMPPLRERPDDIEVLSRHFAKIFCERHGRELIITPEAVELMKQYNWPGNIRELENVVEYLTICNTADREVNLDMLATLLTTPENPIDVPDDTTLASSKEQHEISRIKAALEQSKNLREAGAILGVNASTVSRKIRQYGIEYERKQRR